MAHPQPTLLVMLLDIRVEWKQCNIKVVPDYGLPCAPRFFVLLFPRMAGGFILWDTP